jgi:hypothetical protein
MYRPPILAIVGIVALTGMLGCTKKPPTLNAVKTTGTVTYNAIPVAGAHVTFFPLDRKVGRAATGQTDSAGRFRLKTFLGGDKFEDGALADDYKVVVVKSEAATGADPSGPPDISTMSEQNRAMMEERKTPLGSHTSEEEAKQMAADARTKPSSGKSLLPAKYASETTTDLAASVTAGEKNEFDFDLND